MWISFEWLVLIEVLLLILWLIDGYLDYYWYWWSDFGYENESCWLLGVVVVSRNELIVMFVYFLEVCSWCMMLIMLGFVLGFFDMYWSVMWVSFVVFVREKFVLSFGFINFWILLSFSSGWIYVVMLMSVCVVLMKNIGWWFVRSLRIRVLKV